MGVHSIFRKHILPFFIFSKGERNGIVFLLVLLNLVWVIPLCLPGKSISLPADELAMIDSARSTWTMDERRESSRYRVTESSAGKDAAFPGMPAKPALRKIYEPFDPNTASDETWAATGIPSRTVQTIKRYLEKGGRFRLPDDLKKMYGLSERDFLAIRPWIRIHPTGGSAENRGSRPGHVDIRDRNRGRWPARYDLTNEPAYKRIAENSAARRKEAKSLDINQADSADWESLPGIGPTLSRRIVQFRSGLGGFTSVAQVGEVYGLPDSVFRNIAPRLRMEGTAKPVMIDINQATLETLEKHPYISRKLAGLIIAYRKNHGPFATVEDLLAIPLVDEALLNRLGPYLRFD
jgi:competence ComEA-like helix-hairpin-helix protein